MNKPMVSKNDCELISDEKINFWLKCIRNELLQGRKNAKINWGDTYCIGHVYDGDISSILPVEIIVANSSGCQYVEFESLDELKKWSPEYERKNHKTNTKSNK